MDNADSDGDLDSDLDNAERGHSRHVISSLETKTWRKGERQRE